MTTFFDNLYNRFHELHTELIKTVDGLSIEVLDWVAGSEINSIAVLVVHLTGAERYWVGDVALGEDSTRVRDEEFEVHSMTTDELKARLYAVDEYTRRALTRFSLTDLESDRTSPRDDKTFTVGWCLMHALEHTALHLGHVQLTRQLWE